VQNGRHYRQVKPWGLCENFPVRFRTPVAIFPYYRFTYAGVLADLPDQVQDVPPVVDLNPGRVLWRGVIDSPLFEGRWTIEQLRQDHTPNMIFSTIVIDTRGSTYASHFLWVPGDPTWRNVPFFGLLNPYDVLYTGGFQNGGLVSMRPRTYHEEP
jgi:hypothetical protein